MGPCLLGLRKQSTCVKIPQILSPFGPRTGELCLKICLSGFPMMGGFQMMGGFPMKNVIRLVDTVDLDEDG